MAAADSPSQKKIHNGGRTAAISLCTATSRNFFSQAHRDAAPQCGRNTSSTRRAPRPIAFVSAVFHPVTTMLIFVGAGAIRLWQ